MTLCKVPVPIEIKGNEVADKTVERETDILGMVTMKVPNAGLPLGDQH